MSDFRLGWLLLFVALGAPFLACKRDNNNISPATDAAVGDAFSSSSSSSTPQTEREPNRNITAHCSELTDKPVTKPHNVTSAGYSATIKGKVLTMLPAASPQPSASHASMQFTIEEPYNRPHSVLLTTTKEMQAIYARTDDVLSFAFATLVDDALPLDACIVHMESVSEIDPYSTNPFLRIYALSDSDALVSEEVAHTAARGGEHAACARAIPTGSTSSYSFGSIGPQSGGWTGMHVVTELWVDGTSSTSLNVDFRWKRFSNATLVVVTGGAGSMVYESWSRSTIQALDRMPRN